VHYLLRLWDAVEPDWRDSPPLSAHLPKYPCNFLPDREWSLLALHDESVDRLMHLGGGRFGPIYCLPACRRCRACHPSRIDLSRFKISRSMRRTLNRNTDLVQKVDQVHLTREKFVLFEKFVNARFATKTEHLTTPEERRQFYDSWHQTPMECTREITYWQENRLVAATTVDIGERGIYSHYCYYDLNLPRRRLGIYTFLKEIEMCRERGWSHLYIGFLNMQSKKLRYKEQFSGLEVLVPDRGWVPFQETQLAQAPPLDG